MRFFSYNCDLFMIHHSIDEHPDPNEFPMHAHERLEIFYFISGKATFWVEGNPYPMEPGDIMLFNSSEAHRIAMSPDVPYERVAVHFDRSLFAAYDSNGLLFRPFFARQLGERNRLCPNDFKSGYWRACMENILADTEDVRLQVISGLLPLLHEVACAFASCEAMAEMPETLPSRIVRYVNDNITEELTSKEIANRFFISRSQLYSIFKETTGAGVHEYITAKRLLNAKKLLSSGKKPTAVCTVCGFRDYTAFFRAYKKKFSISPREEYDQREQRRSVTYKEEM